MSKALSVCISLPHERSHGGGPGWGQAGLSNLCTEPRKVRYVRNNAIGRRNQARRLRKELTVGERVLWSRLRHRSLGFRVRRQFPVDKHVLDFYVSEARLCIELDGPLHDRASDKARDERLLEYGIQTLRIPLVEFQSREEHWIREITMLVSLRIQSKPWCKDTLEEDEPGGR